MKDTITYSYGLVTYSSTRNPFLFILIPIEIQLFVVGGWVGNRLVRLFVTESG